MTCASLMKQECLGCQKITLFHEFEKNHNLPVAAPSVNVIVRSLHLNLTILMVQRCVINARTINR